MNTPTFKQQFDKITAAYIENKLDPWEACACFIGNMLNGKDDWINGRYEHGTICYAPEALQSAMRCIKEEAGGLYSLREVVDMEHNFLLIVEKANKMDNKQYENALFEAMSSTLDMLKKIHESKGEVIDQYDFTKRELTAFS